MKDLPKSPPELPAIDPERRRLLLGASALPLAAGAGLSLAPTRARAALKTSARIVIAGSGLAQVSEVKDLPCVVEPVRIAIHQRGVVRAGSLQGFAGTGRQRAVPDADFVVGRAGGVVTERRAAETIDQVVEGR